MSTDLIQARKDAIARGDKELGREIYGQLIGQGYEPADIDASTFTDLVPAPNLGEPQPDPEPAAVPPSDDSEVVALWRYRNNLAEELRGQKLPKTGSPRRAREIEEAIVEHDERIAARLAGLAEQAAAVEAPETTEAPEAPEKAVKPAPKRRTKAE